MNPAANWATVCAFRFSERSLAGSPPRRTKAKISRAFRRASSGIPAAAARAILHDPCFVSGRRYADTEALQLRIIMNLGPVCRCQGIDYTLVEFDRRHNNCLRGSASWNCRFSRIGTMSAPKTVILRQLRKPVEAIILRNQPLFTLAETQGKLR